MGALPECEHEFLIMDEFISEVENIQGKIVKAKMANVECQRCGQYNVQFVSEL